MARRSFKTHVQALEGAKQSAGGGLIERDKTRYLEGTTLAGSSTSTFISALPPPPQPLLIHPPRITPITPTLTPGSEPEPVPDKPPAKKKTQVSTSHQKFKSTVPLTNLIDFRNSQRVPSSVSQAFGVSFRA